MPLFAQVISEGQGEESKAKHTLAGVLLRYNFNGKHGVMSQIAVLKRSCLNGKKSQAAIRGAVTETATKSNALAHYLICKTIPGKRSVRPLASTDPELTGESAGRRSLGNLSYRKFPRSFAGRDDASEKGRRMAAGLENRQAQKGTTTFGTTRGTPAAGTSSLETKNLTDQ